MLAYARNYGSKAAISQATHARNVFDETLARPLHSPLSGGDAAASRCVAPGPSKDAIHPVTGDSGEVALPRTRNRTEGKRRGNRQPSQEGRNREEKIN